MRIDRVKINGFGKIKNKEIEFKDGINIVYGENEAGKSTVLQCMEAILYGICKTKNGKNISDFEKYKPWKNSEFSGKMKYTLDDGEEYEVFRDFEKKNPIIYKASEDISTEFKIDKIKGIHFFEEQVGMDENLFCKTAIIRQQEVRLEKTDANAIIQKISNLVSSGDDTISFEKSMDKLNKLQNERIGTDRTKQKPMNVVDSNIKRLMNERNNLKQCQESAAYYATQKEHIMLKREELQKKKKQRKMTQETFNENRIQNIELAFKMKVGIGILLFLIVVAVLLLVTLKNEIVLLFPFVLGVVDIFLMLKVNKKRKKANVSLDCNKIEKEMEEIEIGINDLRLKERILETEKANMDKKLEELARIEEELEEQKSIKDELLSLEMSYEIAKECLSKAYDEIKHNLSPQFEHKLCEITSNITDGKYTNVIVNSENGLQVEVENGTYMPVSRLSLGTIDEMYLSLRLSTLSEVSKENLPILFDETFAYFDNTRLKNMMCYLQDQNYNNQIIIFTCTNREEQALNELKIEYHLINLEK